VTQAGWHLHEPAKRDPVGNPETIADAAMHIFRHVKFRGAKPHFIEAQILQILESRMADAGISQVLIDRALHGSRP